MSGRNKLLLNILLFLAAAAVIAGVVLWQLSYKLCWQCSPEDYFNRGKDFVCHSDSESQQTGIDYLEYAANEGHLRAQLFLGLVYLAELPPGVEPLDPHSYSCADKLMADNAKAAQSLLTQGIAGLLQQRDDAVPHQLAFNIAKLYASGTLEPPEDQTARQWYQHAASGGNAQAMLILGQQAHHNQHYEQARQWFRQAANSNRQLVAPALQMGDYYNQGQGVAPNLEKAMQWYRRALAAAKQQAAARELGPAETEQLLATPQARIDVVLEKIKHQRSRQTRIIHYQLQGTATHYRIQVPAVDYTIGTVELSGGRVQARLASQHDWGAFVKTPHKTFSSMNAGLEWVLEAYARNRYGALGHYAYELRSKPAS